MTKTEYIRQMYSILVPMCQKYGYHNVAAGMIAQSIQEGWNSGLAKKYFNYWGMKGESKDYKGPKVAMNNKAKTDPAVYRVYYSMEQGCEGYFEFLKYSRYRSLKNCTTDIDYLNKIGPCGWNGNYKYGERCASHLKEVYAALNQQPQTEQPTCHWQAGKTYVTQQDLYIRDNPNGNKIPFDKLTDNAKENGKSDQSGYGILKKGTTVTCKAVVPTQTCIWIQIPSGWVCAANSKAIYIL